MVKLDSLAITMPDEPNPIALIVDRFGGQNAMARAMKCAQSGICEWVATGRVPSKRIPEVIRCGAAQDPPILLQPNDFFALELS